MGDRLSRRQLQCVRLAGEGLSNKEIARRLGATISPNTVNNHLSNAYKRLGTSDRYEAVRIVSRDYPLSSSFVPDPLSTSPPPAFPSSAPEEQAGAPGDRPGPSSWFLPRPDRRILVRLALVLAFAMGAAIVSIGIVSVMAATTRTAAEQAPPDAIRTLSEQTTSDGAGT
ncbi:helix-turn-helix transcriptional regulator [Brevundimonas sp. BR2-1]|uniref:helix-turn-helix domain-containing protein n=1 Tax=unclassified Brevundimonas TaxID=2622653 RepID=UPI002FC915CE